MSRSIPSASPAASASARRCLQLIGTHGFAPFAAGAAMLALALIPVLLARRTAPRIEEKDHTSVFAMLRLAPVLFAAPFVYGAIDAGLAGLMPVYAVRAGYSEAHAALAVTAIAAGSIVFQYPTGWLADRMDRRRLLMVFTRRRHPGCGADAVHHRRAVAVLMHCCSSGAG